MVGLLIYLVFAVIFVLSATAVVRTMVLRSKHRQSQTPPAPDLAHVDSSTVASHLQQAVRMRTISHHDEQTVDWKEFSRFQNALEKMYPLVHQHLRKRMIGEYNLVFIWEGSDRSLEPALLTAHQDVVPPGDENQWTHSPFSGELADGYVWGRGSFDAKGQLIAIMESLETLLAEGFEVERTWWVAFGCDEEVRGEHGAALIARTLAEEKVRFAFVLETKVELWPKGSSLVCTDLSLWWGLPRREALTSNWNVLGRGDTLPRQTTPPHWERLPERWAALNKSKSGRASPHQCASCSPLWGNTCRFLLPCCFSIFGCSNHYLRFPYGKTARSVHSSILPTLPRWHTEVMLQTLSALSRQRW